jgi:hypothetical protein
MADLFPRTTTSWHAESPHPLRRLTLSLPQMALVTGIALHLWRSFALTHGAPDSWAWVGGTFLAGACFLFLMCAIHLANFTLRNWIWRAPLFAVLEAGAEIVVSLALTALNVEPLGADMAELSDWLPTALRILFWRLAGVLLFSIVLGVVVWVLRRLILAAEHRGHTVAAVHRATSEHHPVADHPAPPAS